MNRLLLHGFTGSPATFGSLGREPGAVVPELPGHGKAPPATSWTLAVDQLLASMNDDSFMLGGYSMGARLALAVALRAPDRVERLVLESGSAGLEDPGERALRRGADEELALLLEREGVGAFLRKWEAHPILRGQPHETLRTERQKHSKSGLASALRHLGQGAQPSLWDQLPRLRMPALLVVGERDEKYVALARRMQALLPRAEVQIVKGAGHAPHLENKLDWRSL